MMDTEYGPGRTIPHPILFRVLDSEADDTTVPEIKVEHTSEYAYYPGCVDYYDMEMQFSHVNYGDTNHGIIFDSSIKLLRAVGIEPMILDRSFMKCCGHDQLWQGKVDVFKKIRVAYQDPCRSCRQMPVGAVYEEPRELIKRVDTAELVELKTFRADAQCCGVAQMMYCNDKTKGLTAKRMDEAHDVRADVLLTACPKCLTHFGCLHHENKWKPEESRYRMRVMDITQFLAEALPGDYPTGSNVDPKRKEPPPPGRRG